jgi:hypothetical protein
MALIKLVWTRDIPPCLLKMVDLRDMLLNESHFKLVFDLLWDHKVWRQARREQLQLDFRGVRLDDFMALLLCYGTIVASYLQPGCRQASVSFKGIHSMLFGAMFTLYST